MPASRPVFVAVVVAAVIVAGCGSGHHQARAGAGTTTTRSGSTSSTTSIPTSVTTASTTTSAAPAPTTAPSTAPPSSAAPTTSAPPSTIAPATSAAPPTTIPVVGATSPGRAASALVTAWQTDDRAGAAKYADAAAVAAMFQITREPVQAGGPCQQDGAEFACAYSTKSGNTFFLRITGTRTAGYRVTAVTTSTD